MYIDDFDDFLNNIYANYHDKFNLNLNVIFVSEDFSCDNDNDNFRYDRWEV